MSMKRFFSILLVLALALAPVVYARGGGGRGGARGGGGDGRPDSRGADARGPDRGGRDARADARADASRDHRSRCRGKSSRGVRDAGLRNLRKRAADRYRR